MARNCVRWTRESTPDDNPPVRYHLTFTMGTVTACVSTVRAWGFYWNRREYSLLPDGRKTYHRAFGFGFGFLSWALRDVAEGESW